LGSVSLSLWERERERERERKKEGRERESVCAYIRIVDVHEVTRREKRRTHEP